MSVFSGFCYRKILKMLVERSKQSSQSLTFQQLAESARIPKSYLSKVMNHKAELSHDQLYLICKHLPISKFHKDYLHLLLEYDRSSIEERRKELFKKIKDRQKQMRRTEDYLRLGDGPLDEKDQAKYYLDPIHQIVHICLDIPWFRQDYRRLATHLHLSCERLDRIMDNLDEMKLVHVDGCKTELLVKNLHLSKNSQFYRPWINQIQQLSRHKILSHDLSDNYSFSAIFCSDANSQIEIQERFLEFLKATESKVIDAKPERTMQMNFELLTWAQESGGSKDL
ncbi:DUF4423 domain-containing protein [Pseudobacteriovorax antillogorgiicola]|uniref:TIGR02147 family protein n=1 Tax=Pseudobacteriovorax antillogorgiicola TaxID=1513793 RepID=A0A1Y6CIV8_9BACT|nr:DUF4423 domain-containing protein [Pseudobacteriovorax antillogorgiicola]TCS48660.1 uncharacterized protein (TIGR02147 family) [Pseudobacteriovorax antillogorgiicola]SMF55100.1 TIGR02147 family protein [Pseudobacteriovorax antillogorgiicola]